MEIQKIKLAPFEWMNKLNDILAQSNSELKQIEFEKMLKTYIDNFDIDKTKKICHDLFLTYLENAYYDFINEDLHQNDYDFDDVIELVHNYTNNINDLRIIVKELNEELFQDTFQTRLDLNI